MKNAIVKINDIPELLNVNELMEVRGGKDGGPLVSGCTLAMGEKATCKSDTKGVVKPECNTPGSGVIIVQCNVVGSGQTTPPPTTTNPVDSIPPKGK